jgi:2-iminobutanoate/2-iminopropanoate deaminase
MSRGLTWIAAATMGAAAGAIVTMALRPARVEAQRAPLGRVVVSPKEFPKTGLPYSPGILFGDTLYLSGQLGRDPATAKLVPGGIEPETRQVMKNLRTVLQTAGMDFGDVVSVTAFIRSFEDFEAFNRVYREHFPVDPPARATVQVSGLNLGAAIELQMIAARAGGPRVVPIGE